MLSLPGLWLSVWSGIISNSSSSLGISSERISLLVGNRHRARPKRKDTRVMGLRADRGLIKRKDHVRRSFSLGGEKGANASERLNETALRK